MNLRRFFSSATLIIVTLLISTGIQVYAQTYAEPTSGPPVNGSGSNAYAPLDTGPGVNFKEGELLANISQSGQIGAATNGLIVGNNLIVENGNVGIDTPSPQSTLDVNGNISASGYVHAEGCPGINVVPADFGGNSIGTLSAGSNGQVSFVSGYNPTGGNCSPETYVYQCTDGSWRQIGQNFTIGNTSLESPDFTRSSISSNIFANPYCNSSGP